MNGALRAAAVIGMITSAAAIILFAPGKGRVLIAGDRPVTEEQVLAALESQGYSKIQMSRDGRWIDVRAIKDGKTADLSVNADDGRLADEPFKDADEED